MIADLTYGADKNKELVQRWWKDKGKRDPVSAVSIMANSTTVPCINIAYWIAEVEGYPEWLKKSVDSLMEFYRYSEVINKPEGCPW